MFLRHLIHSAVLKEYEIKPKLPISAEKINSANLANSRPSEETTRRHTYSIEHLLHKFIKFFIGLIRSFDSNCKTIVKNKQSREQTLMRIKACLNTRQSHISIHCHLSKIDHSQGKLNHSHLHSVTWGNNIHNIN